MRSVFSRRSSEVLQALARGNVLLAFDFDGTLAPIVAEPERAAIPARTRKLLKRVAALYPCIVVSGRGRRDVQRLVRGMGIQEVIGNHGSESRGSSGALAGRVRAWIPVLKSGLRGVRGVVLEEKQFSVSVHYRKSREKKAAIRTILQIAETLPGARTVGGKQVVNIVPRGAPHKGQAVEHLRRRQKRDAVIYVGDDDTDENAFAMRRTGRLWGIRVGARRSSLAHYYVRRQREIDRLLAALIAWRIRPDGNHGGAAAS
jgi:trehalose 6-phosphate phosphatase